MNHVMFDLETFGTRPGCAIRSVGAVAFDPSGGVGETFYRNVRGMSCWVAGLVVDRATLDWWGQQSPEAKNKFTDDPRDLDEVVDSFHAWFRSVGGQFVWSQGASFDEPIWQAAAKAVNKPPPWRYWDSRCTRTIYAVSGFDPRSVPREGTHHSALDDALHQVKCVQESYARLKRGIDL